MKKGKKVIIFVAVGLLAVIVAVALIFFLFGDKLIEAAIETGGSKAMQVDVRLENISTSLLRGKVELNNLEIGNPKGYEHPSFMTIGYGHLDLNTGSLMSDTIEMDKIQFDNIKLIVEQKEDTNNLMQILDNLPKSEPTESKPEDKPKEEGQGKDFRIKVIEINDIEVKVEMPPISGRADAVTLKINPIRLENIGTKEKVDMAGLAETILRAISERIAEQGADLLPEEMLDSIEDELGKETTDALTKGIGDLFKKKDKEE